MYANIHHQIIASGRHNYDGARIPLPFNPINVVELRNMIATSSYPDPQVAKFAEFGWPSGHLVGTVPRGSTSGNHQSIKSQPKVLQEWISKNLKNRTLIGPYSNNPFSTDSSIVPTGAVPKKDPGTFRIIHDLSMPEGDCLNMSVARHTFLGSCFVLTLASVDDVAYEVLRLHNLGLRPVIWGRDLKSAFRQIHECPSSWHLQCFKGEDGLLYVDLTALMGSVTSEMKLMRLGCVPAHAHNKEGHFVVLYVDDYTGVDPEDIAHESVKSFDAKLDRIGMVRNKEKDEAPSFVKNLLGIEFDCNKLTMRLSPTKLQETLTLLSFWDSSKSEASLKNIRSLAGKLLHVSKVVPQSRPFLSRILNHLCGPSRRSSNTLISLDAEFQKDIRWWKTYLPFCNGIRLIRHLNYGPVDGDYSTDASPLGAGAFFPSHQLYFSVAFPDWLLTLTQAKDGGASMNSLEIYVVMLCLRKWGPLLAGGCYSISSDNMSTVQSVNTGRSHAPFRQECLREIALTCCRYDIHLRTVHIPGCLNRFPDLLSRTQQNPENLSRFFSEAAEAGYNMLVETIINDADLLFTSSL